jgi:ubiquinone/menaquinone biosynthesis C-methylase UbiE
MVQFKNAQESHNHSLKTLDIIYNYDSFLDSLEFIADFGCGIGLDAQWWATLETRDDPPEPREYKVYAIDKNLSSFDREIKKLPNLYTFEEDFDTNSTFLPVPVDFIWCHNSFQYVTNPISTLRSWNEQMNVNGMMVLIFPQAVHYAYNRLQTHSYNGCFYNHNIVNLMYMLAVNGFDCRDAYFLKEQNDPWLHAAVYKSNIPPMDPKTTTWYQLAELNLINDSVIECLNKYGYVRQDEIVTAWLDKDFYFPKE